MTTNRNWVHTQKTKNRNDALAALAKAKEQEESKNKSEAQIQSECVLWLWNERPETRGCFFAVTNNSEHVGRALQRKALGLVSGVADCLFIWKGKTYAFEFKTLTGKQSDSQLWWKNIAIKNGVEYFVVRSKGQFVGLIEGIIG